MRHTAPLSKEAAFARGGEQELWLLCPAGGTCLRRTVRAGTSRRAPREGELQRPVLGSYRVHPTRKLQRLRGFSTKVSDLNPASAAGLRGGPWSQDPESSCSSMTLPALGQVQLLQGPGCTWKGCGPSTGSGEEKTPVAPRETGM